MTEICAEVIDMAESAIATSKLNIIADDLHKAGLVATLEDIIEVIKDHDK